MKKVILFAAILFAGVLVVKAENPKGQSTLNVVLNPVQSISVNADASATIDYTTADDYNADKENTISNTVITVYSAGRFNVNVYAEDLKQDGTGTNTIPANSIEIEAILRDGTTIGSPTEDLLLGNSEASLIKSDVGGTNLNYDVKFTGKGTDYMDIFNLGNTDVAQTYTTTVFYTIAPN